MYFKPDGSLGLVELKTCPTCRAIFSNGQKKSVFAQYKVETYVPMPKKVIPKPKKQPLKPTRDVYPQIKTEKVISKQETIYPEREKTKEIKYADFLTRSSLHRCTSEGHRMVDIKAEVKLLKPGYIVEKETVPAVHCLDCHKYFILESDYQSLSQKGTILCNVVEESYWSSKNKNGFYVMNAESLLHKMGYNVRSNNDLSERDRHRILKAVIDNDILTSSEIISHLGYLINRSKNRASFENAISKWSTDRDYVWNLSKNKNTATYEARSITHKTAKKQ